MSFQTNFYNTIFGGSSSSLSFYSMASEMRSINSGAYGRLLKKYYSTFGTQKVSSSTSNTSSTSDSTSTKKTSEYDVLAHVSGHDVVSDTKKTTDTDKTSDTKRLYTSSGSYAASDASSFNTAV